MKEIQDLLETVARLRDPETGCPWDLKQTHQSLIPYLIEEAYEAVDAIDKANYAELKQELGDVLLQVVLHAQLATESDKFNFADIAQAINEKMIRRHPHVFADQTFSNEAEQKQFWEDEKKREKGAASKNTSVLDDLPTNLPALLKAEKIQKRVSRVGFDWDNVSQVIDKIEEELDEVKQAIAAKDQLHVHEELGDLFFAVVNLARFVDINSEVALTKANQKFVTRFLQLEVLALEQYESLSACSLDDLEHLWARVKARES